MKKQLISLFFLIPLNVSYLHSLKAGEYELWYTQPAANWNEALPIGNGRLGAMVFGNPFDERIQLNEESLWAGAPTRPEKNAQEIIPSIKHLLLNGEIERASDLSKSNLKPDPLRFRSYQTLGDIKLEYFYNNKKLRQVQNYKRNLNLQTAINTTEFEYNGIKHKREVFVSADYNVLVLHIETTTPGSLTCKLSLNRSQDASVHSPDKATVQMDGQIVDLPDEEAMTVGAHMRFNAIVKAAHKGGSVESLNGSFFIRDATSVTFYFTAVTDYNVEKMDFDRTKLLLSECNSIANKALEVDYSVIKNQHIKTYGKLFNRVDLKLSNVSKCQIPTNERIIAIQKGASDPGLTALLFNYGRYLMISSSTYPGVLPANLQGIWNEHFIAPWNSDYHVNINLQMNYWPVEVMNLPEAFTPYVGLINRLRISGRNTAREVFNSKGWAMNHATDIFGRTAITADVKYVFPIASAWLVLHLWEHFLFTQDTTYLKQQAYPAMKEATEFVLDFMVEDKNGKLVTAPSSSPENTYRLANGREFMLTYGSTMDVQICIELFNSTLHALKIVEPSNKDFRRKLQNSLQKLPSVKVSKRYGIIQEWIEDYEETEPGHRHISQLFGLFPGTSITNRNPELVDAALKTIERREKFANTGEGFATGWSVAWMINFLARLEHSEKAHYKIIELQQQFLYPNLFTKHPPFQIDANFGVSSGISEMLLQSHNDYIQLLPALPKEWANGSLRGFKARGNVTVDMEWQYGQLLSAKFVSSTTRFVKIKYRNKITKYRLVKDEVLTIQE